MTINTTLGPMDEKLLVKKEHAEKDLRVVEYYYDGKMVHRSAEVRLTGIQAVGTAELSR